MSHVLKKISKCFLFRNCEYNKIGTLDRIMRVDYRLNVKHAPSTKYALSIFARSFIKHPSKQHILSDTNGWGRKQPRVRQSKINYKFTIEK